MKVYAEPCQNCLLSPDRIVSSKRAKQIIKDCAQNQTHFICHKASMNGQDICCKTFFDTLGHLSKNIQFAKWLDVVKFIPLPDGEKLISYDEQAKR